MTIIAPDIKFPRGKSITMLYIPVVVLVIVEDALASAVTNR